MELTSGTLLGGRVRYDQPAAGYRTGIEPVLLAASIPAKPGERVLEAGCGAGAGLLCLAARVANITGLGVERDAAMASLAAHNFANNGFVSLAAAAADVTTWQAENSFDHAFANPPWYSADGSASPEPGRRAAKQAHIGLLHLWVASLAKALRPRGTLSLILPSSTLPEAMAALAAAKCGDQTIVPLWPKPGTPAKLLILQGKWLARGGARLLPGLVLHAGTGFTPMAEKLLTEATAL